MGWRKKGGFSFFSAPRGFAACSRVLSRLASLATRNGELTLKLAVQGMYTGSSDVNRLSLTIKGQHVWTIIPFFKTTKVKIFLADPLI